MSSRPTPSSPPYDHSPGVKAPTSLSWFASGTGFIILGGLVLADLGAASTVSNFILGTVMLIGGFLSVGHAVGLRQGQAPYRAVSGLLYFLAGSFLLVEPVLGLRLLTLIFAASLAASGMARVLLGARIQDMPVMISGTASIMAATVVGMESPGASPWVIGFVVAIDLFVQGIALICTGALLRRGDVTIVAGRDNA